MSMILGVIFGLWIFSIYLRWEDRRSEKKALSDFREFKRMLDDTYWSDTPPDWVYRGYTMDNLGNHNTCV